MDATITGIEIPKSAFAALRLFDVVRNPGRGSCVRNPEVGDYHIVDETEGYLCSTGRSFIRNGTVRPLHIRRAFGSMAIKDCIEDVYFFTALTWTKPDFCTRDPISIKLTDRRLVEDASAYDEDALEFQLSEANQEDAD
jgi:hypothetical protein